MTDTSGSDSPRKIYDVLIVGAGPVGLATAIGLRKRGITNILVIDQASEFRRVGQAVDLLPNGLRAIKYTDADAYNKIKETASKAFGPPPNKKPESSPSATTGKPSSPPKRLWRLRNLQGEVTRSFSLDFQSWFERYGEGRLSLSWFDLQTALRSLLPAEKVQVNHRCVHIEEESEWVRVDTISNAAMLSNPFAHWEMMPAPVATSEPNPDQQDSNHQSFYAKLVVAADGINSTIRPILYEQKGLTEYAKPQYSGYGVMGCLQIENVPQPILEELDIHYLQGERIVTINNSRAEFDVPELEHTRVILFRRSETALGCVVNAPYDLKPLVESSPSEVIELGKKALENAQFLPVFSELINLSKPEFTFRRPYYLHLAQIPSHSQPAWSQGRVVLVGDAAHGMPPFLGQGANQGLEDAAVIVTSIAKLVQDNHLNQPTEIAKVFKQYETLRKPFMEKVQSVTMTSYSWPQQQWDDFNGLLFKREYPSVETLGISN